MLYKNMSSLEGKLNYLCSYYNNTTVKDDLFGAMTDLNEIREEFKKLGVDLKLDINNSETEVVKTPCGWISVDFTYKKNSIWISLDTYDEDDCPIDEEDCLIDNEDEDEDQIDEDDD